ncbi:MAG TPA: Rieske 2Fe-2S domain-containing protein [Stellaceae bacterium]|nr:Rieske 2Fe-2S domain-containing protein [Stellaceae bacterium]
MRLKDSEDLTRVGPGTVMGQFMRQYWLPAAMSSELKTDGDPVRLLLLGERLIAFRDSAGRVGIMDHRCPHRCASLFLGRNEENGLRCTYHGWKYDVDGNCVDTPNLTDAAFKNRVKAKAYRTVERNGLVWVYMGERQAAPPPLPQIEATLLPESEVNIVFAQRECNWLQGLEGEIDTSHFGFLHAGAVDPAQVPEDSLLRYTIGDRAPDYHVAETECGMMYGAYRPAGPGRTYWRFANFMMPFWTQTPQGKFTEHLHNRAWVPMDDHHTMFVSLVWRRHPASVGPDKQGRMLPGFARNFDHLPNTTDWLGRWRLKGRAENDWLIDRDAQRVGGNYSGIAGIHQQDQAITESMGPITDHQFEHLAPSDKMIMATRRRLLQASRALAKNGTVPPGVDDPAIMYAVRSGDFVTDAQLGWRDAYDREMQASVRPLKMAAE